MVTIKQLTLLTVGVGILAFLAYSLAQERRPQASGVAPPVHQAIRIAFGELQERETDYSGTLTLNEGRVAEIIPWRFFGGDRPGAPSFLTLYTPRRHMGEPPGGPPLNFTTRAHEHN